MRLPTLLLSVIALQFSLKSATITLAEVRFGGVARELTWVTDYGDGTFSRGIEFNSAFTGNHGFSFSFFGSGGSAVLDGGSWSATGCIDDCAGLFPLVTHEDAPELLVATSFSLPGEIRAVGWTSADNTYVIPLNTWKIETATRTWSESPFPEVTTEFRETRYVFLAVPEAGSGLLSICGAAILAIFGGAKKRL